MTIASEITALQTNLAAAKNAVTTAGGTVGDTGLAGLASEIGTIPTSSPVTPPSTWAELKAMSTTNLQKVYPAGSVIDLPCPWSPYNNTNSYDITWQVANYETCLIEGDDTPKPCVTLWAFKIIQWSIQFDAKEQVLCDSATELVAEDGVYYYGSTTSSGDITNATPLNLASGDTIPYGDYARIWKSSINTTAANFIKLWKYGYANYKYSNIRQWLNSDGAAGEWFTPTHVGDVAPNGANNTKGFLAGLPSDFLNVISSTKILSKGDLSVDGNSVYTTFDKFFLPSNGEIRASAPDSDLSDNPFSFIAYLPDRIRLDYSQSTLPNATPISGNCWLRSTSPAAQSSQPYYLQANGSVYNAGDSADSNSRRVCPACRIILAS